MRFVRIARPPGDSILRFGDTRQRRHAPRLSRAVDGWTRCDRLSRSRPSGRRSKRADTQNWDLGRPRTRRLGHGALGPSDANGDRPCGCAGCVAARLKQCDVCYAASQRWDVTDCLSRATDTRRCTTIERVAEARRPALSGSPRGFRTPGSSSIEDHAHGEQLPSIR